MTEQWGSEPKADFGGAAPEARGSQPAPDAAAPQQQAANQSMPIPPRPMSEQRSAGLAGAWWANGAPPAPANDDAATVPLGESERAKLDAELHESSPEAAPAVTPHEPQAEAPQMDAPAPAPATPAPTPASNSPVASEAQVSGSAAPKVGAAAASEQAPNPMGESDAADRSAAPASAEAAPASTEVTPVPASAPAEATASSEHTEQLEPAIGSQPPAFGAFGEDQPFNARGAQSQFGAPAHAPAQGQFGQPAPAQGQFGQPAPAQGQFGQPAPAQGQFGQPGPGFPAPSHLPNYTPAPGQAPKRSRLVGIIALLLGLIAVVLVCFIEGVEFVTAGLIVGLIALVLGILGIKKSSKALSGIGLALGSIAIIGSILTYLILAFV
ncbi:hypothetical protein JRG19_01725 [Pseudoclavibacter alba]|uniref:DUF308 domain-containing protein n=1 Tax=Pseudoclavibacter albus TaxID=272241 RepID=UPI0019D094AB|nr:DUF308 domain-containing protein [Pseudoclavibacter alba]MBN6777271.1 hypothetical protein [Pseudoclavibacter alba]